MAKKKDKKNVQQKMMHIHSVCDQFEFYDLIPERRGLFRVRSIRAFYRQLVRRNERVPDQYKKPGPLKVKMTVVNPEIF